MKKDEYFCFKMILYNEHLGKGSKTIEYNSYLIIAV